jgi:hypothetical protein
VLQIHAVVLEEFRQLRDVFNIIILSSYVFSNFRGVQPRFASANRIYSRRSELAQYRNEFLATISHTLHRFGPFKCSIQNLIDTPAQQFTPVLLIRNNVLLVG